MRNIRFFRRASSKGWIALVIGGFLTHSWAANGAPTAKDLKIQGHPRLLLTEPRLKELLALKEKDPHLQLLIRNLLTYCDETLPLPVEKATLQGGSLLEVCRTVQGRMASLGMGYLLTRNPQYKARLLQEAESAARFPDWNPVHFLDVAEMTLAFALAYDWLYNDWSEAERKMLRDAILTKGLSPTAKEYEKSKAWTTERDNWNQVCNGGATAGAIAVLTEEPKVAEGILAMAVKSAQSSKEAFSPDGVCEEGVGYWGYATTFGAIIYDSLAVAFGTDYGLSEGKGLSRAPIFLDAVLPNENIRFAQAFNFADDGGYSRASAGGFDAWYWFAKRFGTADLLDNVEINSQWIQEKARSAHKGTIPIPRLCALSIVWFTPHRPRTSPRPLDFLFTGRVPVVSMRSSWEDADATHLFLKGGDNSASHNHLDLGSFEMIAQGVKWASDLGMDSYALPGYFGKPEERGAIYRISTRSHNTLSFQGANQKLNGTAPIVAFASAPSFCVAVVDLSNAYEKPRMRSMLRGFLFDRKRVLVQDELDLDESAEGLRWAMATSAGVKLNGTEAVLTSSDGKSLTLHLLAPAGAVFSEASTKPPTEAENQNTGTRIVAVDLPHVPRGKVRIAVTLCPGESASLPAPTLKPLTTWVTSYPVKPAK